MKSIFKKLREYIKQDFTIKNILITLSAILLCDLFSFSIFFMGVASGAGLSNYDGNKDSWNYFFSKTFVTFILITGMFILPALTALGLIGFWGNIKPKLSKFFMFSAPITVVTFITFGQLFAAFLLALSAVGIDVY